MLIALPLLLDASSLLTQDASRAWREHAICKLHWPKLILRVQTQRIPPGRLWDEVQLLGEQYDFAETDLNAAFVALEHTQEVFPPQNTVIQVF